MSLYGQVGLHITLVELAVRVWWLNTKLGLGVEGLGGGVEGVNLATALKVLQTRPCSQAGICGGLKGGIWKVCLNFNFDVPE